MEPWGFREAFARGLFPFTSNMGFWWTNVNRSHALKHGRFTRERLAEQARLRAVLRTARAAMAEAKALLSELRSLAPDKRKE